MEYSLFSFFTDAVLRGPTIGTMLMCLAAALVGVIVFLRKQSLIGEALSHAAYPGVIAGVILGGFFNFDEAQELTFTLMIMAGAFCTALLGLIFIRILEKNFSVRSDSALCFILSAFFGIGITMASHIQFSYTALYRQAQAYLYGQAATMTDVHIVIYGILSILIVIFIILYNKELETISFNPEYAKSIGINIHLTNAIVFLLTVLAVIIGIRSVGVVLMSAMLIAPAAAARQYSNNLNIILLLAGIFGLLSAFLGNYFSVKMAYYLAAQYPQMRLSLPTGPMIVLTASLICILSLLFAPERGLVIRIARAARFRYQCTRENTLKAIWRHGADKRIEYSELRKLHAASGIYLHFILATLVWNGWLQKEGSGYKLTHDGQQKASRIVRLHRLWEVYLADYLGAGAERVHYNAEEMEHIITPEIEAELITLLKDPKVDPHHQVIPSKEAL